jgi:hypothetical protein
MASKELLSLTHGAGDAISHSTILHRMRAILSGLDLDCECRTKLDGALQRFEALEERRQLRRLVLDARYQVERIAALLDLVRELDEISADEPDLSVFEEIAHLFKDMEEAASRGARDMASVRECRRPSENSQQHPTLA